MWKSTIHSRRRIFMLSTQRKGKMNYFPMHISQEKLSYAAVKKKSLELTVMKDYFPFMPCVHCGLEGCPLHITFAKSHRQAEGNSIWGWPATVAWGRGFGKLYTCT